MMAQFPSDIQDFANQYAAFQEKRHKADYDPSSTFTRRDVLTSIDAAAAAIKKLKASSIKDRRAFAVRTAMIKRPDRESHTGHRRSYTCIETGLPNGRPR